MPNNFKGAVRKYRGTQVQRLNPNRNQNIIGQILLKILKKTLDFSTRYRGTRGTQVRSSKNFQSTNFFGEVQRYRGTRLKIFQRAKHFWPGTEVQRYRGTQLKICQSSSIWARYRGTQLEFSYYFTDVQEFLLKIDQGTEVHRYRAQNLPEMKIFLPGTEVQRYTAQNLSIKFNLGQVQRYRGTQLKFSCYFIDEKEFLLKIYLGTEVTRYRT